MKDLVKVFLLFKETVADEQAGDNNQDSRVRKKLIKMIAARDRRQVGTGTVQVW